MQDLEHKYSDNIFNQNILIIGIFPPPLGGIAVHIKRVINKLILQHNKIISFDVKRSLYKGKLIFLFKLFKTVYKNKINIIYYHSLILWRIPIDLMLLIILKPFFDFRIVLVDHTPRFFYKKSNIYKKFINFLFKFLHKQVLIGDSTFNAYIDNKIFLKNYSIESPFLPPNLDEENNIFLSYPKSLINFIDHSKRIILFNASSFKVFNHFDLYGFDFAIQLLQDLQKNNYNFGLVIACATIENLKYYQLIKEKIQNNKNVYLLLECKEELWPLIKRAHFFIRPTYSDAFGISVQEAIYFNVSTIASDVCQRPKGTILFKSRDYHDFYEKVTSVLN